MNGWPACVSMKSDRLHLMPGFEFQLRFECIFTSATTQRLDVSDHPLRAARERHRHSDRFGERFGERESRLRIAPGLPT